MNSRKCFPLLFVAVLALSMMIVANVPAFGPVF